jgi:hypothetical protein
MRGLTVILLISICVSIAFAENPNAMNHQTVCRLGFVYFPTGSVKAPADVERSIFYDSFAYRLGGEYFLSDYLSVGPGIEYLNRKINPDAYLSSKISLVSIYIDARFSYPMTDSGRSCFVIGLGTGVSHLAEKGSVAKTGPSIYSIAGFNIGVGKNMGWDLLYRYGFTRVDLPTVREYRFESWAFQTSLSYRFKL